MEKQILFIKKQMKAILCWLTSIWERVSENCRQMKLRLTMTQEQQMLAKIEALLASSAKKQNEINDYRFFSKLGSIVQSLLEIYERPYLNEKQFCTAVFVDMNNRSVPYLLSSRKERCLPEAVSAELAQADAETLQKAIAEIEDEMPVLSAAAEWDRLADDLIPLLGSIIEDAQAGNAALCRKRIGDLITLLADYQVEAHSFWEDCIQESAEMQRDFIETNDAAVPMLYWTGSQPWTALTSYGYYRKKE